MTDFETLCWIQSFACGFRHSRYVGGFFIDWLDAFGHIHSTSGCNLKEAVMRAKRERDSMAIHKTDNPEADS